AYTRKHLLSFSFFCFGLAGSERGFYVLQSAQNFISFRLNNRCRRNQQRTNITEKEPLSILLSSTLFRKHFAHFLIKIFVQQKQSSNFAVEYLQNPQRSPIRIWLLLRSPRPIAFLF
ncbi:hypothetical protein BX666DRAFT_1918460, partial [Dichotomocladium elegans]